MERRKRHFMAMMAGLLASQREPSGWVDGVKGHVRGSVSGKGRVYRRERKGCFVGTGRRGKRWKVKQ